MALPVKRKEFYASPEKNSNSPANNNPEIERTSLTVITIVQLMGGEYDQIKSTK
jgi:hypothetical protein